jgi:multidrug efflux pump subunit AcrA (membrane-fusion protein)
MKHLLFPLLIITVLAGCGGGADIDAQVLAKRAERDSLKTVREKINADIAALETWLGRNDPEQMRSLPTVTTYALQPREFAHWTEAHGSVRADQNALVYTATGGEIRRILVQQGQPVKKGQEIVSLDTDGLRQQVQQAETSVELARTVFERQSKLWEQQVGSEVQ